VIAHDPLHGSGRADFPHPGWDRTQRCIGGQRGVAVTGSSSEICRCLVPRLGQFLTSPRFIPDGGIAPVRLGIAAFP